MALVGLQRPPFNKSQNHPHKRIFTINLYLPTPKGRKTRKNSQVNCGKLWSVYWHSHSSSLRAAPFAPPGEKNPAERGEATWIFAPRRAITRRRQTNKSAITLSTQHQLSYSHHIKATAGANGRSCHFWLARARRRRPWILPSEHQAWEN